MADAMDLDMSLDDIAKKRKDSVPAKRGRGGAARGGAGAVGGRTQSSLKETKPRPSPYVCVKTPLLFTFTPADASFAVPLPIFLPTYARR